MELLYSTYNLSVFGEILIYIYFEVYFYIYIRNMCMYSTYMYIHVQ